jgi:hypothetical protein
MGGVVGRERRVSRKGSTGSRSSRSRSSPRIAPSKNNMYSSDDDGKLFYTVKVHCEENLFVEDDWQLVFLFIEQFPSFQIV